MNYQAVRWNFDLSRNSSLRTLETTANSITAAGEAASGFLNTVLSTVTSPLPLDLVINYDAFDVRYHVPPSTHVRDISPSRHVAEALVHLELFKVFREIYVVREFRLMRCADEAPLGHAAEDTTRALECVVEVERMNGDLTTSRANRRSFMRCDLSVLASMMI